jgi:guanylate kinase
MSKRLITITGPSGSGKTELLNKLCETGKFSRLLSVTTRPKRESEVDGIDYHFTSEVIFKHLLGEDQFVQHVHFQDKYYGTLKSDAEAAIHTGCVPVAIVEPTGIPQFQKYCGESGFELFTIFVQANFKILVQRYLARLVPLDLENPERITYHAKRIAAIHDEHSNWGSSAEFNCTFMNSGNDLNYVSEMAKMIGTYIEGQK